MKRILILTFFINILTSFGFGQIQIGGEQSEVKKEPKNKPKEAIRKDSKYDTEIFIGTTIASTYRSLIPNKNDLFADSIGIRADEKNLTAWSFHLGFTSEISKNFMWDAGISFLQNGEKYDFSTSDTTHNYTSNYSWLGIPIKLYVKHDFNKFRLKAGVGIVPHMQMKFRREDIFRNQKGVESIVETKTINKMNTFGLSTVGNIGLQYNFTDVVGFYALFEYRYQLTSSYQKTYPYIHRGTAIGLNFGLTFGI